MAPSATLHFHPDHTVSVSRPPSAAVPAREARLRTGETLRVLFSTARTPQVRGDYMGQRAWNIIMYHRPVGEEPASVAMTFPEEKSQDPVVETEVVVPDAGEWECWFSNTGRWGTVWDSDYGKNFRFIVERR